MRPTMPNSTASRCRTGCRTTAGELFTHTLRPSASAIEARKRLCFPDLFLVVSPATVALEYLSRGLSVCRVGCYLSHQTHYAGLRSALRVIQGLALRKPHYPSPSKPSKVALLPKVLHTQTLEPHDEFPAIFMLLERGKVV